MNIKFLPLLLLPLLGKGQTNANGGMPLGGNTSSEKQPLEIKRNALFNLEEIKVRWKKAALENCQGVPCSTLSVPGDVRDVVVTDGLEEGEVIVTFSPPLSDGGSPIIEYEVEVTEEVPAVNSPTISSYTPKNILIENITITSNDTPLTMAEDTNEPVSGFVVSSIIRTKGLKSHITVKGLKISVSYIFKVFAKNLIGSSPSSSVKTVKFTLKVFPCVAGPASSNPSLIINTPLTNITHNTIKATGIGPDKDLPAGVTAAWASNVITISGTPTAAGTFNYMIPLTGGCGSVNATGTITVNPVCPTATITYNSYTYNTVAIGTQCWMKENLRTRVYNDGTEIRFDNSGGPGGSTSQTWSGTGREYGAYTIYAHDSTTTNPSNLTSYGYLYNWYAVKGIASVGSTTYKNICPTGWHVPTDTEWTDLTYYLGVDAGGKMKSTSSLWNTQSSGANNSSGFTALPGGYRFDGGNFNNIRYNAVFWSATENGGNNGWYRSLSTYWDDVSKYNAEGQKSVGHSVRCLLGLII
jgi:uncharacterized protein (TIGR02145 family)